MATRRTIGPDGEVLDETIDYGDGTGVHTDYRTDPPTVTNLTDLPVVEPEPPSLAEVFAAVPVQTLAEANEVLANLKEALEQRGIV